MPGPARRGEAKNSGKLPKTPFGNRGPGTLRRIKYFLILDAKSMDISTRANAIIIMFWFIKMMVLVQQQSLWNWFGIRSLVGFSSLQSRLKIVKYGKGKCVLVAQK